MQRKAYNTKDKISRPTMNSEHQTDQDWDLNNFTYSLQYAAGRGTLCLQSRFFRWRPWVGDVRTGNKSWLERMWPLAGPKVSTRSPWLIVRHRWPQWNFYTTKKPLEGSDPHATLQLSFSCSVPPLDVTKVIMWSSSGRSRWIWRLHLQIKLKLLTY